MQPWEVPSPTAYGLQVGTRLCDSVPLGSDWTYPAPSAQMFLPHVWFGNLRWIVGERFGTVGRGASSRVYVTRAPMAAWPFSRHLAGMV